MCLYLENGWREETEKYKSQTGSLLFYKILTKDLRSPYHPTFKWEFDKTISVNRSVEFTKEKVALRGVSIGLHLFIDKPNINVCQYPCLYPCPCLYLYPCPYRGTCRYRVFQVSVKPEDIIVVSGDGLVVIKAKLVKEV